MNDRTTVKQGTSDGRGGDLRRRLVLGTALATSAIFGGYRGYIRRAFADCAPTSPGTYTCSGTTTGTQRLPPTAGAPLVVTTEPGFGINTTGSGDNAFTLTGTGGLTFTDDNLSPITGDVHGIDASNVGSGALSITTSGTVTGESGTGITVNNAGTDLTIKAAKVNGNSGIVALNYGTGVLSITATGTVTGSAGDGIFAHNSNSGTGLAIDAATVIGGADGIYARNDGSGALSITGTGTVAGGTSYDGIYARNYGTDTTGLTIGATDVSGGRNGISARNDGSDVLSITATGTVTGETGNGIYARNYGTGLTINAVDIGGGTYGILARNDGSGALAITTTGTVAGVSDGILASNSTDGTDLTIGAADVSGGRNGIYAGNDGSGALSITTSGTVTGTNNYGIYARNYGTDLTIEAAEVSGGARGIDARNYGSGALSIITTGTVTGASYDGIAGRNNNGADLTIEAADVSGGARGIFAENTGSGVLSITATGTVTGTSTVGIDAGNAGTDLTIEAADVSGGNSGIVATNNGSGALSITATGTVEGSVGSGIFAVAGSTTTGLTIEADEVSGGGVGVNAVSDGSGALSITTTGTVTGASYDGINARNNGMDLTIKAADVSGGRYGINARNYGTGALSITATGTVTGTSSDGIYARASKYNARTGTDLTIDAMDVSGGRHGIHALTYGTGVLSITATGTVTGGNGDGIFASAGTDAEDAATTGLTIAAADVSGTDDGILALNFGSGALSITATGTVTGTTYDGISADNNTGAGLTIAAADVYGGRHGIFALNQVSGALSITATGTVTGTNGDGILAFNRGTDLTIKAADVSGADNGIYARGQISGVLSITASGTVTGTNGDGIYALAGKYNATNIDMTIAAVDVSGGENGIYALTYGTGALSITATGTVTGDRNNGIIARNSNSGTDLMIEAADVSGGGYGILALNYGGGVLAISASGTVTGGTSSDGIFARSYGTGTDLTIEAADVSGGNFGIAAINYGSGVLKITASGTVTGTSGDGIYARNFGTGTDLTIEAAAASGGRYGIFASNNGSGALSITTTKTVTGDRGYGILAINNSTSTDSTTTVTVEDGASVSGGSAGVGLVSTTGRAATLTNAGSIAGATGILASGGPATLSNTGTITGTGGPAIDLTDAGGPSTVNQKGGTITGAILLSAAADTVNVTGGAIAGNIVGQGNAHLNFTLGSGTFEFAAPFAATGMADVNMNSGTVAIAGTIDTDVLTVNDGMMTVAGAINTPAFELNGGVLSVSSDANLGSGAGDLNFDGGTFVNTAAFATARDITLNAGGGTFETDADLMVASGITGTGALTKTGAAALILNGVNSFTGLSTINAGMLVVGDDSHAAASLAGNVMVNSGGTLGGIGTVGTTTIASGGTIAPGNSIGTLTVAGDITFASGSTYVAEINPALDSDLIDASGKATIEGGTVYAAKVAGVYTPGSRWTIVGANSGRTGTFDALDQNMPFVDLALAYDPNHVYIDATRNAVSFCDVAQTANQCATGDGLESTGPGNPVYDAVAAIPDEDSARHALDQLSGEVYASTKSALIEDSRFVREAATDRIRSAFGGVSASSLPVMAYGPESLTPKEQAALAREGKSAQVFAPASADTDRLAVWAHGFGSWGTWEGTGNAALERSIGGILIGADAPLGDWRVGLLAGYSHSSFNVDDRASSGDSDNYHIGVYGGTEWGNLGVRLGAAYTWHDIETSCTVAFPGFADSLSADYDAATAQVFGELGYRIDMQAASFEPFANLAYVNLHTDGFTEKGGAAALSVRGSDTDATFTTIGLHASTSFDLGGMKATARGTLGWRHAFGDTTPFSTHAFAGGDPFAIAGVPIAEDAAVIEAGFDLAISPNATLGLSYSGQIASNAHDHGFNANFAVRF